MGKVLWKVSWSGSSWKRSFFEVEKKGFGDFAIHYTAPLFAFNPNDIPCSIPWTNFLLHPPTTYIFFVNFSMWRTLDPSCLLWPIYIFFEFEMFYFFFFNLGPHCAKRIILLVWCLCSMLTKFISFICLIKLVTNFVCCRMWRQIYQNSWHEVWYQVHHSCGDVLKHNVEELLYQTIVDFKEK